MICPVLQPHPHPHDPLAGGPALLARVQEPLPHPRHKGLRHVRPRRLVPELEARVLVRRQRLHEADDAGVFAAAARLLAVPVVVGDGLEEGLLEGDGGLSHLHLADGMML